MNKPEVVTELMQFFAAEFPEPDEALTEDTNLLQGWFMDSLAIVTPTLFIEEHFGVPLSRADINGDNFQNVSTLADLVLRKLPGE